MLSVAKTFHFSAAHRLPNLPKHHPCRKLHGHNYAVTIRVYADAICPRTGFAQVEKVNLDYRTISSVYKEHIHKRLDHNLLNKFIDDPTAEAIAVWVHMKLRTTYPFGSISPYALEVTIKETDATECVYRPDQPAPELETAEIEFSYPITFTPIDDSLDEEE